MHRIVSFAALSAALLALAAPANASLIGNNVTIKRIQGGSTVFKSVDATVGAGIEYNDNFFNIDVTENQVLFRAAGGTFSLGDIFYAIDGLDFDNNPATANTILDFSAVQIFAPGPILIDQSRVAFDANGRFTFNLRNTTGGSSGQAAVTFGAAAPADVPEPAMFGLVGLGVAGLVASRRKMAA